MDLDSAEQSTIQHYEELAPFLDEMFRKESESINVAIQQWIGTTASISEPILDYGSGDGTVTMPLLRKGYMLDLYDPAETCLEISKNRILQDTNVRVLNHVNTLRSSYGLIILKEVLYHILRETDRQQLLRELSKRLVFNGSIIIIQEFLDEKLYAQPVNFIKVAQIKSTKSDVYIKRSFDSDLKICKTDIEIRSENCTNAISAAYFATYSFEQLVRCTAKAGLFVHNIIDLMSSQTVDRIELNKKYLIAFKRSNSGDGT